MQNQCIGAATGTITYTYEINGLDAVPLGEGDLHDPAYDYMEVVMPLLLGREDQIAVSDFEREVECMPEITFSLYPSKKLEESFYTNEAMYYTIGVIAIFGFTTLVFILYDLAVGKRQNKVMARIMKQNKIVSNIFPSAIVQRLYGNDDSSGDSIAKGGNGVDGKDRLPGVGSSGASLDGGSMDGFDNPDAYADKMLADLFPEATIIYLDITGFTAWSSAREPPHVFVLLEKLYGAFDKIAYRHGVFKVGYRAQANDSVSISSLFCTLKLPCLV